MNANSSVTIMEYIMKFTKVNNLAERDDTDTTALVVNFRTLSDHLKFMMPDEYTDILQYYEDLFDFLMKQERNIYDKESDIKWKYCIMHGKKYCQDDRYKKMGFPPLRRGVFYRFNLFILFQEPVPLKYHGTEEDYFTLTEKLTKDIEICFEENISIEKKYQYLNHFTNYINKKFHDFFDDIKISVEIIGSPHTKLDLDDSNLNLGIRIPQSEIKRGALLCDTRNWSNTLYDPHYLAECLRKIGMEATLPIPLAKRTRFTEPKSGLVCFIGVDDGLIFERDILITEYLKLDKRVRPLIIAILKFSRSQRINKSCCISTLSTYSYIMMTLHFLMNVLENPVIPNLQNLSIECNSTDCCYHSKNELVTTFFDKKIENLNIRYHDCIRVINKQTSKYNCVNNNETKRTIWYSENDDNLGVLFFDFITYYSRRDNYKKISIVNFEKKQTDDAVWVQDPYMMKKNIARNCKYHTLKMISKVFTTAAEMLKDGYSYQEVCDKHI